MQVDSSVAMNVFYVRMCVFAVLATMEDRHAVTACERGGDDVPSNKHCATEHENVHYSTPPLANAEAIDESYLLSVTCVRTQAPDALLSTLRISTPEGPLILECERVAKRRKFATDPINCSFVDGLCGIGVVLPYGQATETILFEAGCAGCL